MSRRTSARSQPSSSASASVAAAKCSDASATPPGISRWRRHACSRRRRAVRRTAWTRSRCRYRGKSRRHVQRFHGARHLLSNTHGKFQTSVFSISFPPPTNTNSHTYALARMSNDGTTYFSIQGKLYDMCLVFFSSPHHQSRFTASQCP